MLNRKIIIGVDVGNLQSGVVVILGGEISNVNIFPNNMVFEHIRAYFVKYKHVSVIVEDIKPYAGNLSQQAIDTCKFIGELNWRFNEIGIKYSMITRSTIRKWVYDSFPDLVRPLVEQIIVKRNEKNNDGKNRKPSFVYVNDSIVVKAMRLYWGIEMPPPGYGYVHGLKTHTWQALALASFSMKPKRSHVLISEELPQTSELPLSSGQIVS